MPTVRTALLLVLALLAGCSSGPPPNARLADLPGLSIGFMASGVSDSAPAPSHLFVSYDIPAFRAIHHGDCAVVDDSIAGTFNGLSIPVTTLGGGPGDLPAGNCGGPGFDLSVSFGDHATFVVWDGSLTVTADFGTTLVPRVPTLRSPAAWRFAAGEAVSVGWPVAADLPTTPQGYPQVYFSTGRTAVDPAGGTNYFDLAPQFSGDQIDFTVPSPAPVTGPGFIVFAFGWVDFAAIACTGATACTAQLPRGYQHSVEIPN
jgi:hypothetical protein